MSTRSNIIVEMTDGSCHRIYCHNDGYPEHHAPILCEHYTSQSEAEALVSFGNLSRLAESNTKPAGHSFAKPVKGHCVYYGRDRGEHANSYGHRYSSLRAALNEPWGDPDYIYVWEVASQSWFVMPRNDNPRFLVPLARFQNNCIPDPGCIRL
jgi:hypothetical protein